MRKARIVFERPVPATELEVVPANTAWRLRAGFAWAGLGFVVGAVFWHFVGFWSFLSGVVLDRIPSANAAVISAAPDRPLAGQPPIIVVDTNRCTMLSLDRRTNLTVGQPCPAISLALRFKPYSEREDLTILARPRVQAAGYRAN